MIQNLSEVVTIRRMTGADVDQVIQLDAMSFATPWPETSFAYELTENKNANCWVALHPAGRVIGFLIIWLVTNEAHIATIAVHPDYRRLGIAQRLLKCGLVECIQNGAESAMLEVRAGNQAAIQMYRKFGFEQVGRRFRYYQDNHEDAILMTAAPLDEHYVKCLETLAPGNWSENDNTSPGEK